MLFQQTSAPPGWTKQVILNDYALRVTSGAVGSVAGSSFSSVFAQTVVGNTTLDTTQIPPHNHSSNANSNNSASGTPGPFTTPVPSPSPATINNTGGGLSHTHSINLTLSYVDVIIASKN
jgi:microcystin-dependent protein